MSHLRSRFGGKAGTAGRWRVAAAALPFLLLTCDGCGGQPATPQTAAIRAIEGLGGKVQQDLQRPGRPVVIVWLLDLPVTDEHLASLTALTDLRELYLSRSQVTDAGLKHLAGLAELEKLDLFDTAVTDV